MTSDFNSDFEKNSQDKTIKDESNTNADRNSTSLTQQQDAARLVASEALESATKQSIESNLRQGKELGEIGATCLQIGYMATLGQALEANPLPSFEVKVPPQLDILKGSKDGNFLLPTSKKK